MEEEETSRASERPPWRPSPGSGALNLDNFSSPWMSPFRRRNPRVALLSENGFSLSLGGGHITCGGIRDQQYQSEGAKLHIQYIYTQKRIHLITYLRQHEDSRLLGLYIEHKPGEGGSFPHPSWGQKNPQRHP